jgi:hypothetical protein
VNAQDSPVLSETEKEELLSKKLDGVLRGYVWGLPPTLILESEKGTFVGAESGRLFYIDDIEIGDSDSDLKTVRATIGYDFKEDQLWRARVFIEKKYLDPRERINDLMRIRKELVKQYGDPVDEIMVWHDNREKNWPESWGWAVLRGEMTMTILFQDGETLVRVFLGTREKLNPNLHDPEFNITYTSLEKINAPEKPESDDFLQLP